MTLDLIRLWPSLIKPLCGLLSGLAAGLFLASLLESLKWSDYLARLARPLIKAARLNPAASASFAMAAISPAAANASLAENYDKGLLSARDLILANLFNSLPANLVHLPSIFFLTWPVLGPAAFSYAGVTLMAALGRTIFTVFLSRALPRREYPKETSAAEAAPPEGFSGRWKKSIGSAAKRFRKRLPRLFCYTIPFYLLIYFMNEAGLFAALEKWLGERLAWLSFLKPQAMSVVVLQMIAETGAGLGAAGALLETGGLTHRDAVLAMLAGGVLAAPMRAIRHQLPAYAGFFKPSLALRLVLANQGLRAASMTAALVIYAYLS